MVKFFAAAMSAVTAIGLGIAAMHFRQQELNAAGLSGADAEAYNLTVGVSTNTLEIVGQALPWLFVIVLLVILTGMLLLTR